MTRVVDEAALVLHARPYRETSAIVTLLTAHYGRIAVVARGARGKRGSILQPFNRVRVSWSGKGSLQTLTGCELTGHAWLSGTPLASGFYVIELVNRLLAEHESAPDVYTASCWALERLEAGDPPDVVLRVFEKLLLDALGYGLDFSRDAETGEPLRADLEYVLHPESGFVAALGGARGYSGAVLADIASARFQTRDARVAAKKIFRQALAPLLGSRPLASRRLLSRQRA